MRWGGRQYDVPTDALNKLTDVEAALAVVLAIDALPEASAVTVDDKGSIEEARSAYDALTDDQKGRVPESILSKLTADEGALKAVVDAAAANDVVAKINALPDASAVTVGHKNNIESARSAYDALTDDQKAMVPEATFNKLTDDEAALAAAQKDAADAEAANDVVAKIEALPAASAVKVSDKETIEAARSAYDDLTDGQKAKVSADILTKLTDDEAALKAVVDAAAANDVVAKISALPDASDVTISSKEAIENARAAYDALTDDQKTKVPAETLKRLTDDETALKPLVDAAAANDVIAKIEALPDASAVKASDKSAIEEARAAYDALADDQKGRVPESILSKLTADEAALKEVVDAAAADAVVAKIDSLPAASAVKVSDKGSIEAARSAYEALTSDQKAKVPAAMLAKLEGAEKALATAQERQAQEQGQKQGQGQGQSQEQQGQEQQGQGQEQQNQNQNQNQNGFATQSFLAKAKVKTATVKANAKSATVKWAKVKGAEAYQVQYRIHGGAWKTKTVKAAKVTLKGLKKGKLYDLRVRAVAGESVGAWSTMRRLWTKAAVGVKAASPNARAVEVTWKKTAKANAGYKISVRYSKSGKVVKTKTVKASKRSVVVKGLKAGKKAWVTVQPLRKAAGKVYTGAPKRAKKAVKVAS